MRYLKAYSILFFLTCLMYHAKGQTDHERIAAHKIKEVDTYQISVNVGELTGDSILYNQDFYDKKGYITKAISEDSAPYYFKIIYNKRGQIIKRANYEGEKMIYADSSFYNKKGQLTTKWAYRPQDSSYILYTYQYNKYGRLAKGTELNKKTLYRGSSWYKYLGNTDKIVYLYSKSTKGTVNIQMHKYNKKHQLIEDYYKNFQGHELKLAGKNIYSYIHDADGMKQTEKIYSKDSLTQIEETEYDKRGNKLKIYTTEYGVKELVYEGKYNDKNQLIESMQRTGSVSYAKLPNSQLSDYSKQIINYYDFDETHDFFTYNSYGDALQTLTYNKYHLLMGKYKYYYKYYDK
ncbi:hypothetical protein [uncultured Mucilaginibacter sp.]|uniref:hypothetical protein n=1 Tax=uncultured Mucilaginibacter sp. TaxID=797541 RepID=UPI0025CC085D|nr:hypothetical protein [uncultured Mucilaginibacter sp.]